MQCFGERKAALLIDGLYSLRHSAINELYKENAYQAKTNQILDPAITYARRLFNEYSSIFPTANRQYGIH